MSIARDTQRSFSETIAELVRRGLGEGQETSRLSYSHRTGLPVIDTGRTITTEDVRSLEDEEL